jgi:hypothetical protein
MKDTPGRGDNSVAEEMVANDKPVTDALVFDADGNLIKGGEKPPTALVRLKRSKGRV